METKAGALDRIRKFGGHMSGMVMPNLGAFVGWASKRFYMNDPVKSLSGIV